MSEPQPSVALLPTGIALVLGICLVAGPAVADGPVVGRMLTAPEIARSPMAAAQGLVTLVAYAMVGEEAPKEVEVFEPRGEGGTFLPAGTLPLRDVMPVLRFDYEGGHWQTVYLERREDVEGRESYVLAVVDARRGRTAWLRLQQPFPEGRPVRVGVHIDPFAEAGWIGGPVEIHRLAAAPRRLFEEPRDDSPSTLITRPKTADAEPYEGWGSWLYSMEIRGDFLRVGRLVEIGEDYAPLGWIRWRDEDGAVSVWPMPWMGC